MTGFDPHLGKQIGPAWRAIRAKAAEGWIDRPSLVALAMDAGPLGKDAAQKLVVDAITYGVFISHGKYKQGSQRDFRSVRLVPMELAHPNALQWYIDPLASQRGGPLRSEGRPSASEYPSMGVTAAMTADMGNGSGETLPIQAADTGCHYARADRKCGGESKLYEVVRGTGRARQPMPTPICEKHASRFPNLAEWKG